MSKTKEKRGAKIFFSILFITISVIALFIGIILLNTELQSGAIIMVVFNSLFLLILFLVKLFKTKNKLNVYKNDIKEAKSNVRVLKGKYSQVLVLSDKMNNMATKTESGFYIDSTANKGAQSGHFVGLTEKDNFLLSIGVVSQLAEEYQAAQNNLNSLIKMYNAYIKNFPTCIYAWFLRAKEEHYIDDINLYKSTHIVNDMDNMI